MAGLQIRFSLQTLLLTVLLGASGFALYWNWGPWKAVAFPKATAAAFGKDGSFFAIRNADRTVQIYDAAVHLTDTYTPEPYSYLFFAPGGGNILILENEGRYNFPKKVAAWNSGLRKHVKYPSGSVLKESPQSRWLYFQESLRERDEELTYELYPGDLLCLVDARTGEYVLRWPHYSIDSFVGFSLDDRECIARVWNEQRQRIEIERWDLERRTLTVDPILATWYTPDLKTGIHLKEAAFYEGEILNELSVYNCITGELLYQECFDYKTTQHVILSERPDEFIIVHEKDGEIIRLTLFNIPTLQQRDLDVRQVRMNDLVPWTLPDAPYLLLSCENPQEFHRVHVGVWNRETGKYLGMWPSGDFLNYDGKLRLLSADGAIYEIPKQEPIAYVPIDASSTYVAGLGLVNQPARFLAGAETVVGFVPDNPDTFGSLNPEHNGGSIMAFKKQRPFAWWGVVYLAEFWVTLGLFVFWVRHVWRGRHN